MGSPPHARLGFHGLLAETGLKSFVDVDYHRLGNFVWHLPGTGVDFIACELHRGLDGAS